MRGLARTDIGQDGCGIPGAGPVGNLAAEEQPRALRDAVAYLAMNLVARLDALHRPELRAFLRRIAHRVAAHRLDQRPLEVSKDRADDDETLAGNAALAAVDHARGRCDLRRSSHIDVVEDDVSVRAAELQHALLEHSARCGRDAAPGADASGERDRGDIVILDQRFHLAARQEQRPEQVPRHARLVKQLLDRERAAGHVARMFQQRTVASHERRSGEAEHLPEGEIPRHHGQHHAERVESDERLRPADVHRLRRQIVLGMVGEPVALEGAFLDLDAAVVERLAHLLGHQPGEFVLAAAKDCAGFADDHRPLGEARPAPA